jgi:hypothetical protein
MNASALCLLLLLLLFLLHVRRMPRKMKLILPQIKRGHKRHSAAHHPTIQQIVAITTPP